MSSSALLQHADFLRALARSLVSDEAAAEDAVQEAWVAALERPPDAPGAARSWLRTVVRRFLGRSRANAIDRRWHERRAARPEAGVDPHWMEERERTIARVGEAVSALDEKYRSVVLLRFFEGLPPREIARRLQLPVETVRTRQKRALQALRGSLDDAYGGDRRSWCLALLPLTRLHRDAPAGSGLVASVITGFLTMNTLFKVSFVSLAVLAGALAFWLPGDEEAVSPPAAPLPLVADGELTRDAEPEQALPVVAGAAARMPLDQADQESPATSPPVTRGQVFDAGGRPAAGVALRLAGGGEWSGESDAAGEFALPATLPEERLIIDPPHVLVRRGWAMDEELVLLIAASRIDFTGRVVDETGVAIAGVDVSVESIPIVGFPRALDRTIRPVIHTTRTDDAGGFEHPGLPAELVTLHFTKPGFRPEALRIGADVELDGRVVLHPIVEPYTLSGTVVDDVGIAVPDALVAFVDERTRTDRSGAFLLEGSIADVPEEGADLAAAKRGFQTKLIPGFGSDRTDLLDEAPLELRFDGPSLEITGRLLYTSGEPHAGARVQLWQEEYVVGISTAEDLSAKGAEIPLLMDAFWSDPDPCLTDHRGAFVVKGLADRDYRLRILDLEEGLALTTEPIPAGSSGLSITLPDDTYQELSGSVVDEHGRAIEGMQVMASTWVIHNSDNHAVRTMRTTHTEADGSFVLSDVSRLASIRLRVLGDDSEFLDHAFWMEPDEPGEDLTLILERRCHFRVEVQDSEVHSFRILDELDEVLMISHFGAVGGDVGRRIFPLEEGRSPVVSTSDRARTLELLGTETRRVPIRLVAGEVTILRP